MSLLISVPQSSSTNDAILDLLHHNAENFTGLYTLHQTKGRGQYGNRWLSNPGENLAYSVAVQIPAAVSGTFINYCTAVLLREFVDNLAAGTCKVKWPNDLILNGKKIAGILIEQQKTDGIAWHIIGIGINVLQTDFGEITKAGSIFTQCGRNCEPSTIAKELHRFLSSRFYAELDNPQILEKYNSVLFKKDEIAVFAIGGMRQNGIIKCADAEGYLWVELEKDGLRRFFHKEIELLY